MNVYESPRSGAQGYSLACPSSATCSALGAYHTVLLIVRHLHLLLLHHPRGWENTGAAFTAGTSSWKQNVCAQQLWTITRTKVSASRPVFSSPTKESSAEPKSQNMLKTQQQAAQQGSK